MDTHSKYKTKGLYAFPTYRQMNDFYATRISPEFDKGYYKTLKSDKTFSMNKMAIRDSILFFRTSSKGASMEGVDCDYIGLDEYDRLDPLSEQSAINFQWLYVVIHIEITSLKRAK